MPSLNITDGECADEEKVCPQSCDAVEAEGQSVPVCDTNFVNYRTRFDSFKFFKDNYLQGGH